MDRETFCNTVLSRVRYATDRERTAIRRELEGHIADHAEALEEQGFTPGEAIAQAEEAMGDPGETARELAKCYSPFWLWLGRAVNLLLALAIPLCIWWSIPVAVGAGSNLLCRVEPKLFAAAYDPREGETAWDVDVRATLEDQILRIYMVSVDREAGLAQLHCCYYAKNPFNTFRSVSGIPFLLTLTNQRGEEGTYAGGMGSLPGYVFWDVEVPVAPGDTTLTYTYEWLDMSWEIPLPPEVTP